MKAHPAQFDMFEAMKPPPPPPRPERELLEAGWALIDEADRIIRTDGTTDRARECWAALRAITVEMNGGDSCGCAVYPNAAPRLDKYLRARAKAEKRFPMWGVAGRFALDIRGCRTSINIRSAIFSRGFETRSLDPEGSPYWSETGYRSWSAWHDHIHATKGISLPDAIRLSIEGYIDGPTKDGGGCGGKLAPWWRSDVSSLRQARNTLAQSWARDSDTYWRLEERSCAVIVARGLDPDAVAPWPKGKAPKRTAARKPVEESVAA